MATATATSAKIKVSAPIGKRGGSVVVERVPVTAIKDNTTTVMLKGKRVKVQRLPRHRNWTPVS
jgi:hypothetical protein